MSFAGGYPMNLLGFNKLTAEKRKDLILVLLGTAVVLGGLGFGLIRYQYGVIERLEQRRVGVNKRLEEMHSIVRRAAVTEKELAVTSKKLAKLEEKMASSRDVYTWMVTMLGRFKQPFSVDIPQVSLPVVGDVTLLPKFPYKQATLKISGTGRYHEIGRFLAEFENKFPHMRLLNLEITPASTPGEQGLLSFNVDVVSLVNPNPS
jgi:Tfp pilus assembly protein PilO